MSQENIDRHERFVAALNTREISDEIAEELIAPDCRVVNISTLVTALGSQPSWPALLTWTKHPVTTVWPTAATSRCEF